MKKTILTLASVVALAGAASAQTVAHTQMFGQATDWTQVGLGWTTDVFGGASTITANTGNGTQATAFNDYYFTQPGERLSMLMADINVTPLTFDFSGADGVTYLKVANLQQPINGINFSITGGSLELLDIEDGSFIGDTLRYVGPNIVGSEAGTTALFRVTYAAGAQLSMLGLAGPTDGINFSVSNSTSFTVPEPSSTALFGLGTLGLLARRKR